MVCVLMCSFLYRKWHCILDINDEIDEDINTIPPPDIAVSEEESQDRTNIQSTRWIIAL